MIESLACLHMPSSKKKTLKICSRGHTFYKSSARPVCPICWPGRYKKERVSKQVKKPFIKKHTDGTLWAKGQMLNGKMDGYWEWFRKDGTRMRSGYFKAGKPIGDWTTYAKTGRTVKVTKVNR
jgi:hypothetical protein